MKILILHEYYQQPGGEDSVFRAERDLLKSHGHDVRCHTVHNDTIGQFSHLSLARQTVWSRTAYNTVSALLRDFPADVVHCHNTFPLLSPSVYSAARKARAAVVQTLHNYRLICIGPDLFRDGHACEACVGHGTPWRGVVHRCYRQSLGASATAATMLAVHNALGTWSKHVSCFVVPSAFAREKFIAGGLPAALLKIKPNFVSNPVGDIPATEKPRRGALYVGRLVEEKGVSDLLNATKESRVPITLAGEGPLVQQARNTGAATLGHVSKEVVYREMQRAAFLVAPSRYYETFGLAVIEGFANGLPAIVPRESALAELVEDGQTGLIFCHGKSGDLTRKMAWAASHPEAIAEMGHNARRVYEDRYTPERNYRMLMEIYDAAIHSEIHGFTPTA